MKYLIALSIILFVPFFLNAQQVTKKFKDFGFLDSLQLTSEQVEKSLLYLDSDAHSKVKNSKGDTVIFTLGDAGQIIIFTRDKARVVSLGIIEKWLHIS
jgi:hypothetical protein